MHETKARGAPWATLTRLLVAGLLFAGTTPGFAKSACMSTAELDRLLPAFAPWSEFSVGGFGQCKYASQPSGKPLRAMLGVYQNLKDDTDGAAKFVLSLRDALEKQGQRIEPMPGLGTHGFLATPQRTGDASITRQFAGHNKRLAINGSLLAPADADPASWAEGVEAFMRAALAVADDPEVLSAASCPWFDESLLRRLLPGTGFSQQAYGERSCFAKDASMMLKLSINRDSEEQAARIRADNGCAWTPVAELGAGGYAGHGCAGKRTKAIVEMRVGTQRLEYMLLGDREATEAERALLLEMALKIHGGR